MEYAQDIGISLIQAFQALSPVLDGFSRFFYLLGSPVFFLLLITLVYWTVNRQLGITVLLVFVTVAVFGLALQQLLHLPRPYWLGVVRPWALMEHMPSPPAWLGFPWPCWVTWHTAWIKPGFGLQRA